MRHLLQQAAYRAVQVLALVATALAFWRAESFFTTAASTSADLPGAVAPQWAWVRFVILAALAVCWFSVWMAGRELRRDRDRRNAPALKPPRLDRDVTVFIDDIDFAALARGTQT